MNKSIDFIIKLLGIVFRRSLIITFYLSCLLAFLYFPHIVDYFKADDNSITVYTFTEFISSESLRRFEQKTGIKVRLQFFESNEELYAKFKINQGEGYDLITPSDYMVDVMRKDGLLQNIDIAELDNFKDLDPRLLGQYFDPDNKYSIPLCWLVYGIVYNKGLIGSEFRSADLDLLFSDANNLIKDKIITKPYRICMIQDPREMVCLGALYLFGRTSNLTEQDFASIQDLLSHQKKSVESYTSVGVPYFLMGNIASVAVVTSHQMRKMFESNENFVFEIPKKGSLFVIENLAIPAKSQKTELVHKFIDFMISEEIAGLHSAMYGTNPSNKEAYKGIDKKFTENPNFFPTDDGFSRLHLIKNDISLERVDSIWLAVRFY